MTKLLFANGWFFFVPYLLLYLYFKFANLPTSTLHNLFIILHVINFILLLFYLYQNNSRQRIKSAEILFWLFLAILFLQPRAYLEFPSDPWEHFRRIFSWSAYSFVGDNPISHKFTYFWGWTLMSNVQPLYRRIGLDIYSAFWQLLLAYQFYLLALRLGFDKSWAKVQVVATIFLFGTNLFGFYRYYALSSTPLAYIAYLRSLIILINARNGDRKQLAYLLPLTLIMYYNHIQELLLLLISGFALVLDYLTARRKQRKIIYAIVAIAMLIALILGAYVVSNPQLLPEPASSRLSLPHLSSWGSFRIWDPKLPYFETIAVHGFISLLLAVAWFAKHKTIALLTLIPYFLMLFPPFVLSFVVAMASSYSSNYGTYRALYAFPTSFMLVLGLKETFILLTKKFKLHLPQLQLILLTIILAIVIALPPMYPYRGRFWFQIYQPPVELSLQRTDVSAQWLLKHRQLDSECLLVSDGATSFMVATHLALGLPTIDRRIVHNPSQTLSNDKALQNYVKANNVCSLLVAIPAQINPPPVSLVGQLSGHWYTSLVNQNLMVNQEFINVADSLVTMGWTKTFVPPFYWLYENPS